MIYCEGKLIRIIYEKAEKSKNNNERASKQREQEKEKEKRERETYWRKTHEIKLFFN